MRPLVVAALGLALAATAAAAPPRAGIFVPGRSLGGLRLGVTQAQVRAAWGDSFGRCRGCDRTTWYFTYVPFAPQGAGVEFRLGRAIALFTLWRPDGWRTPQGLRLGDRVEAVTRRYGALTQADCGGYTALLLPRRAAVSLFYAVNGRLWGFGLIEAPARPCR